MCMITRPLDAARQDNMTLQSRVSSRRQVYLSYDWPTCKKEDNRVSSTTRLSGQTQKASVRTVRQLAQHYHESPDFVTEEELEGISSTSRMSRTIHGPSARYVRLLRPPLARFSTLILVLSKKLAMGVPQPICPVVELLTVELPMMNSVGWSRSDFAGLAVRDSCDSHPLWS